MIVLFCIVVSLAFYEEAYWLTGGAEPTSTVMAVVLVLGWSLLTFMVTMLEARRVR